MDVAPRQAATSVTPSTTSPRTLSGVAAARQIGYRNARGRLRSPINARAESRLTLPQRAGMERRYGVLTSVTASSVKCHISPVCRCGQGDSSILCAATQRTGAHVIRPGEVIRLPDCSSSTFSEQRRTRSEMLREMSGARRKVTFCLHDVAGSRGVRSVGRAFVVANDDGGR
jgi:hypothetical protein